MEAEEAAVAPMLHMLRSLAESSRADHMMEILSYVLSFGSFVVFVWVARCAVASPTFRPESGRLSRLVFACVSERPGAGYESRKKEKPEHSADARPDSFARDAARLAACTLGIQVSYLMWGLMQERIMTRPYSTGELFRSSKFLVFANRFLALLVACTRPLNAPSWRCHSSRLWPPGLCYARKTSHRAAQGLTQGLTGGWDAAVADSAASNAQVRRCAGEPAAVRSGVDGARCAAVQVRLLLRLQHRLERQPVRGAQVRLLPDAGHSK